MMDIQNDIIEGQLPVDDKAQTAEIEDQSKAGVSIENDEVTTELLEVKEDTRFQVMPKLSPEEAAAFKEDVKEHGIQEPIVLDENQVVVDGYNRFHACKELGIPITEDMVVRLVPGLTEEEKLERAVSLNMKRRHLSSDQKAETVWSFMTKQPGYSDRKIAEIFGISHTTVASIRKKFSDGQNGHLKTVQGSDGKAYPSSKEQEEENRQKIRETIQEQPELSDHAVAKTCNVSSNTVKSVREGMGTDSMQVIGSSDQKGTVEADDIKEASEPENAYQAPYSMNSPEVLAKIILGEADSVKEWLHTQIFDCEGDPGKKAMLASPEGSEKIIGALATFKRAVDEAVEEAISYLQNQEQDDEG